MQSIKREKQVNHDGKFNPSFFIYPAGNLLSQERVQNSLFACGLFFKR